jgi:ATP-dependent Clp protease ATP-binding subunit ClpC
MSDREQLHTGFALESLGRELTKLAGEMELDPVLAPERVTQPLAALLASRHSPLLIGRDGVGKKAGVETLALKMALTPEALPEPLREQKVLEVDSATFQHGCLYVHEFETRLQNIVKKSREAKTILFLDQLHLAVKAGALSSYEERTIATLLLPAIARREITLIGATTPEGYQTIVRHNPQFAACFTPIEVSEATAEQTLVLMEKLRSHFERRHQIRIDPASLTEIVRMTRFYTWQAFPGKAFGLLKAAIAEKALERRPIPDRKPAITVQHIQGLVQKRTGLPSFLLFRDEPVQRDQVIEHLKTKLFEQDHAIEAVADAIVTFKAELNDPHRPVASFLFTGPTGVGKTELVKLVAEFLFSSRERVIRYDMGEYADPASVARLVGEGRQEGLRRGLVEEVLVQPFSVILFDEIEKAHPSVFSLLLPVLGEGRLTDVSGRSASFSNAIIIMTSNLGSDLYGQRPIGLLPVQDAERNAEVHKAILRRIQDFFAPEFLNRLSKILTFEPLPRAAVRRVAEKTVQQAMRRPGIRDLDLTVSVDPSLFVELMRQGYHPAYGARPMERTVQELVIYPLARVLAAGRVASGQSVHLTWLNGHTHLTYAEAVRRGKRRRTASRRIGGGSGVVNGGGDVRFEQELSSIQSIGGRSTSVNGGEDDRNGGDSVAIGKRIEGGR